jgi:geranylgeranyl diphosphate synthase type II
VIPVPCWRRGEYGVHIVTVARSSTGSNSATILGPYLEECKELVLDEIRQQFERYDVSPYLTELMLDYPLRGGKALRPALAIATCRALGGTVDGVLPSAATLELFHNAFLIHDDVEDESHSRRGRPTMHLDHGVPIAINVGDAMLSLTLPPLLDNTRRLGLGAALAILDVVATMTRRSVMGQACELRWIRENEWSVTDADYTQMVVDKTGWYSFIAPLHVGAIASCARDVPLSELSEFGEQVAIAFQITDDVLNLDAASSDYGKEHAGDLWEGKRTLPLLHALRSTGAPERERAIEILGRPRPIPGDPGDLDPHSVVSCKTADDVEFLRSLIDQHDGIGHAMSIAESHAHRAMVRLESWTWLAPSTHVDVLRATCEFVHRRRS